MNIDELNTWIQSDEGKTWLDGQKKPLIEKRDELLGEVKNLGEKLTTANQRAADSEKLLTDERNAFNGHVVNGALDALMTEYNVLDGSRDAVRAALKSQDIAVVANGENREVQIKKDGQEQPLTEYFEAWAESDAGKSHRAAPINSGGGAHGGAIPDAEKTATDAFTAKVIEAML